MVVGILLAGLAVFLAGALAGRLTAPDRGPRKKELARAKEALAKLDDIISGATLELGMLGSNVATKAGDVLRKYWKES